MIEHGLFKKHFIGRDGFNWWMGQIPPEESWKDNTAGGPNFTNSEQKGFGERYRVRILGHHTANADDIPDDELPWAYVMYPVTAGGGGRGSSQSANITQGTFVFGFFMDGEDGQLPIIMGCLGNNDYNAVMKKVTPTRFIPFAGYPEQDEVHGSKRSTLQIRSTGGGEVLEQENATGSNTNSQYTESAQGNTSTTTKNDVEIANDGNESIPLAQTSECEKAPMGDMQIVLMNALKEVQKLQKQLYDARSGITAGIADAQAWIQKEIDKAMNFISSSMKWIFTEMKKFVLKQINNITKRADFLTFPNQRELLRLAIAKSNDTISCLFRKLIDELPALIGSFLGDMFGNGFNKAVNIPKCFVEDFIGGMLGGIVGIVSGIIDDALGAISSVAGMALNLIGDVIGFVEDLLSFLMCNDMNTVECPVVNEWSLFGGPGGKSGSDILSLIDNASNFASKVDSFASKAEGTLDTLVDLVDIDLSGIFANSICDLGPIRCGPPGVEYVGRGTGASINLITSAAGQIMGGDVLSAGYNFVRGLSFLNVKDDCGKGTGAVIKPVFGPSVDPDGNDSTGIVDIIVVDGGTGYIPSPDGSQGGSGNTWSDASDTIITKDNDDGSTDYYTPVPPGNVVTVPPDATVTTPPNSNTTEVTDDDGNQSEVLPGVPTKFPNGGTMTSPPIREDITTQQYPSSTSYPVILYLCELIVEESGMDYEKIDEVVIEPSMGATASPKFDKFGRLLSVKVTAGGEGFQEIPKVYIKTETGFGSSILPKFCIDRLGTDDIDREPSLQDKVITVIDCVGNF